MDDKNANIDLLFRNGLKDFEVLPPDDVWDKISPAVRKQQRVYIILRAAAMIAVLVTLGFLSSTWNNEINDRLVNSAGNTETNNQLSLSENTEDALLADAIVSPSAAVNNYKEPYHAASSERKKMISPDKTSISEAPGKTLLEVSNDNTLLAGTDTKILFQSVTGIPDNPVYPLTSFTETKSAAKGERWSVAALVSPTYLSSFQSETAGNLSQLASVEQPVVSYAGGFALSYKLNKRLSVQSGLYYSSYGNELTGITAYGGFQAYDMVKGNRNFEVSTTNGTVFTNNSDVYLVDEASDARMSSHIDKNAFDPSKASLDYLDNSLRQNLSYLEVPVILRYKLIDRSVDFNIIGGLSSNLLVNNSVYTNLDGSKYEVGTTGGLNTLTFSSSLGMGFEYSLSGNLSFSLEPTFRYFLNPYNNLERTGGHPYSFGVFSGFSYRF